MKKIMAIVCAIIMIVCNVIITCAHSEFVAYDYGQIDNMNMRMVEDIANKYETKIQITRYEDEDVWEEGYSVTFYEVHCDRWYSYAITFVNHKYTGTTDEYKTLAIHNNNGAK